MAITSLAPKGEGEREEKENVVSAKTLNRERHYQFKLSKAT